MDHSCNSGSLQSSSGGEEDYVSSKPNSLSNFFNSCLQPPPPPPPPPSFFDSFPNYLDSSNFPTPLPVHHHHHQHHQHHHHDHMDFINISSTTKASTTTSQISSTSSSLQHPGISSASRQKTSKKRTRASRRAPTTVLTTDTSNFRAMVQEFTGIPTASFMPYSSTTLPPPRFDLLHSVPPYLLRPFAQKVVHSPSHLAPPPPPPPPSIDHVISSLSSIHSAGNANTSATCSNSSANIDASANTSLGLNMQSQNPILSFQSMQDHHHASNISSAAQLSSRPLDFGWQKGTGQSDHQTEERGGGGGGGGIDSWVLSSD